MLTLITGLLLGSIVTFIFERILLSNKTLKKEFWDNPKIIFGYHFHHSILGLLLILLGVIMFLRESGGIFLIGTGLGIIIIHTRTDKRLVFIEKPTN